MARELVPNSEIQKEFWSLYTIERASLFFSVLILALALILKPTVPFVVGVVSGSVVGFLNFRLLKRFVTKLLNTQVSVNANKGFVFLAKMLVLGGVVGVLILVVKVNPIAFMAGFSAVILAIFYEGFKSLF